MVGVSHTKGNVGVSHTEGKFVLATWKGWMVLATRRWWLVLVDGSHKERVGENYKKLSQILLEFVIFLILTTMIDM